MNFNRSDRRPPRDEAFISFISEVAIKHYDVSEAAESQRSHSEPGCGTEESCNPTASADSVVERSAHTTRNKHTSSVVTCAIESNVSVALQTSGGRREQDVRSSRWASCCWARLFFWGGVICDVSLSRSLTSILILCVCVAAGVTATWGAGECVCASRHTHLFFFLVLAK